MDDMEAYNCYWDFKRFFENEEFNRWGLDENHEIISSSNDASSLDNVASPSRSHAKVKSIEMERKRRRKLNERLYTLRSVVPKISKMDKASIIKDAIEYIQELQEQERRLSAEVSALASSKDQEKTSVSEITQKDDLDPTDNAIMGKFKKSNKSSSIVAPDSPDNPNCIEVLELTVSETGERKVLVISITFNKKKYTLIKVCELFESLNLKVMSANVSSFTRSLLHMTLSVEIDEVNCIQLKKKVEAAIAEYDS